MISPSLPNDPAMLLSAVNMKLRDYYPSLDELCLSMDIDPEELKNKLAAIDYHYDPEQNRFR